MKSYIYLFVFLFLNVNLLAQDTLKYDLPDVVITAFKRPVTFRDISRTVDIFYDKHVYSTPFRSLQDMLVLSSGLDLRKRGPNGVQADLAIRGGTFEQTAIMLDGTKINDPQTGHHNLILPVSFGNIQRIEIVKGGSSSIHGANAFTGTVNLIPKFNQFDQLVFTGSGGSFGYYYGSIFGSLYKNGISNNLSFDISGSDGYRDNTDFNTMNISYAGSYVAENYLFKLYYGLSKKDFGANSFYTTSFPLQAEKTTTHFIKSSMEYNSGEFGIKSNLYWRKNYDDFVLDKTNPGFYQNIHKTNIYGIDLETSITSSAGVTTIGGEFLYDDINSTNLGVRNRKNYGIILEHNIDTINDLIINISGFSYKYAEIGWKFWPGFDLAYKLTENLTTYFNISKSFRIPTYTELYYTDPITKGNPVLSYEESLNYEVGINFRSRLYTISSALFRREGKNLIDWIRRSDNEVWQTDNIAVRNTNGLEINFESELGEMVGVDYLYSLSLKYAYLESSEKNIDYQSRYLLDYLKHQFIFSLSHRLPFNIIANWYITLFDRMTLDSYVLMDIKINKSFNSFELFLSATNLFDIEYEDIPDVLMPGRWITGGIKFSIQ